MEETLKTLAMLIKCIEGQQEQIEILIERIKKLESKTN